MKISVNNLIFYLLAFTLLGMLTATNYWLVKIPKDYMHLYIQQATIIDKYLDLDQ